MKSSAATTSKRYEIKVGAMSMGRYASLPWAVKRAKEIAAEEAGFTGTAHWRIVDLTAGQVVRDGIVNA
jgi:hypothetical protein